MRSAYTIAEIECAINYWREHQSATDAFTLPNSAAILADCYGGMIYDGQVAVSAAALSDAQRVALDQALGQRESERK